MINLLAIKSYEESFISHRAPNDRVRRCWEALGIHEQSEIAERRQNQDNYLADRKASKLSGEEYGSNN